MKNYKFCFTLAATMFLTSSCYDLDITPKDQLAASAFWKTQDHADQGMMAVYNQMQSDDVFGRQFSFDNLGGVASGYDNTSYAPVARGIYDASSGLVNDRWKNLYEGIARANIVLQNVDRCNMSDELKLRYKGEARFMRALYYFTLIDTFGDVPLYDESTIIENEFMTMLKKRSSVDEVRQFILNDLDFADEQLPTTWEQNNSGRATKAAAMSLKGKVLLYAKKYTEALTCFNAVITNKAKYGEHELYPDYANLFKPGGDESNEMIFAIQNIGGVGKDYGMPTTFYMGTRASFGSCWNNVMASVKLVDSYETKDGKAFNWDDLFPGYNENKKVREEVMYATLDKSKKTVSAYPKSLDKLKAMYNNRDPRMAATVILPYTHYAGWVKNAPKDTEYILLKNMGDANENNGFIRINQNYKFYPFRKFVAEGNLNGEINNRKDTPINFPLIRLADVYLMMAECYNETNDIDNALKYINMVRQRPSVNMFALTKDKYNTKEAVFERIRLERSWELAAEGWSFSDMRRWGLLETLNGPVKDIMGDKQYDRKVNNRDYLWPIPQKEIDQNEALKPNNPGW